MTIHPFDVWYQSSRRLFDTHFQVHADSHQDAIRQAQAMATDVPPDAHWQAFQLIEKAQEPNEDFTEL